MISDGKPSILKRASCQAWAWIWSFRTEDEYGILSNIWNRWRAWCWSFRGDNCEVCLGERGGMLGNENVDVDGTTICDYCSADRLERPRYNRASGTR